MGWAVLCLLMAVGLSGCEEKSTPEGAVAPKVEGEKITFATNAPQLGYLTIEPAQVRKAAAVGLYGRLAWDDDLTARVFSPIAGRIITIPVEVNQEVAADGELALLDSPDFGQALANARTATGNLAAADKALDRSKELLAHGAAAQKEVAAAEAAEVAAAAERDRAEATLANYGGQDTSTNEYYWLRSPLAGVVVEKNVSPGQEIRADLMLANAPQFTNPQFVVTDPTRLWLFLDVDELSVTALAVGREVLIHTPAYPDKVFHAQVQVIGQELDPTTRTIKVRCLVNNSEHCLRAEMYVTAEVVSSEVVGVDVPTKAVFLKNESHCVFVETSPGEFEQRTVTLGAESNGRTTIVAGIEPGQPVVSDGCLLLKSMLEGDNS
jgi:cobalt-zinc-cadmium efflux system membrane fusion protein